MAMMPLTRAVLVVCKALNPFFTRDLVKNVDGAVVPINGAADIGIADALISLHQQDKRFELHVVDNIMNSIFDYSRDEGFDVVISKAKLVKGTFKTIGSLAQKLRISSKPADEAQG